MSDAVTVVAECETSTGLIAIVEDSLNKDVYHVFKKDKNIQPNHDARGVMRYLMHMLHAFGYKADKATRQLEEEKQKTKALEAKVKLLEQLVRNAGTDGPDVNIILSSDNWQILYTLDGRIKCKHKDEKEFRRMASIYDVLLTIYNKENL